MDRLRAIDVFIQVAELDSFTRAADALGMPRASVTHWVQQLEAHLGVRLLQRTTRRVQLTDDGAAYLEAARRLRADLDELDASMVRSRTLPRGRLRVDVPASAGRHVLAPALPRFLARYPDLQVELGSTDRPVDLIAEGIDCVIRGGGVHDASLVARPLGAYEVVTCASPDHLARVGIPQRPQDLEAGHGWVAFFSSRTGRAFDPVFERGDERVALRLRRHVAANDADSHVELVRAGLGVAQLPRTPHVDALLRSGALVRVLPDWDAGRLPLTLLYPRNRHLAARVRVFVDWVVELYEALFRSLAAPQA